jgi:hypothetical protein
MPECPASSLLAQYQLEYQLLFTHRHSSREKEREVLALSETIHGLYKNLLATDGSDSQLLNQITAENSRLYAVERSIADDFKAIDRICDSLEMISKCIEAEV